MNLNLLIGFAIGLVVKEVYQICKKKAQTSKMTAEEFDQRFEAGDDTIVDWSKASKAIVLNLEISSYRELVKVAKKEGFTPQELVTKWTLGRLKSLIVRGSAED